MFSIVKSRAEKVLKEERYSGVVRTTVKIWRGVSLGRSGSCRWTDMFEWTTEPVRERTLICMDAVERDRGTGGCGKVVERARLRCSRFCFIPQRKVRCSSG